MPRDKDESDSNRKKSRDGHQVTLYRPLTAAPLSSMELTPITQKGYQGQNDPIDADRTVDQTERNNTTDESSPIAPYTGNKK